MTASAGTVQFSSRGEMVWIDRGEAVVLDPWERRLVAGGSWKELSAQFAPAATEPVVPCLGDTPPRGQILGEKGEYCLVRQGNFLKLFWSGRRLWRSEIPGWWGNRHTQAVFDSTMAVLYDGRTVLQVTSAGDLETWDVGAGHGSIALHGDKVAFSGRPDVILDLFRKQLVDVGPIPFEDVRWRGGTVVGGNGGHAVVWGEDGVVRFVLDEPDYGERRLSADGRELGLVFVRESVRLGQLRETRDGEVLGEWEVCGDGHRIWPVGQGRIVDLCAREVWLRSADGEQKLSTIPGLGAVSHVSLADDGLRVVAGDGSHGVQVWSVPLGGGKAVQETWDALVGKDGTDSVKGYEGGQVQALEVEAVHGKPVEIATARAFRKMERAAKDEGVRLEIASGFRTWGEQKALYDCYRSGDCNGGNLAAPPGYSNHQSGLALDLNTHVPAVRRWLRSRGKEFGFAATVRSEPWHWEYVGGERNPAVAAALLPPAEPLFQVPRTPWTL